MAKEVFIDGSDVRAKARNPWGVLGLSLITLGIYPIFWWYFINRELRDLGAGHRVTGQSPLNGWIAALIWIFTLGLGGLVFTQYEMNKLWEGQPVVSPALPGIPTSDADLDRLSKLQDLRDSGALSDEEFEAEKARLLPPKPLGAGPSTTATEEAGNG